MSDTHSLVTAMMCVVAGVLMFLGRNLYGRFMVNLLRGFTKSRQTHGGIQRLLSVAMGIFGAIVVILGIVIGANAL